MDIGAMVAAAKSLSLYHIGRVKPGSHRRIVKDYRSKTGISGKTYL